MWHRTLSLPANRPACDQSLAGFHADVPRMVGTASWNCASRRQVKAARLIPWQQAADGNTIEHVAGNVRGTMGFVGKFPTEDCGFVVAGDAGEGVEAVRQKGDIVSIGSLDRVAGVDAVMAAAGLQDKPIHSTESAPIVDDVDEQAQAQLLRLPKRVIESFIAELIIHAECRLHDLAVLGLAVDESPDARDLQACGRGVQQASSIIALDF